MKDKILLYKIATLVHNYEKRLKEKKDFIKKKWHNSHIEGIAIQLEETIKDLKRIQSEVAL